MFDTIFTVFAVTIIPVGVGMWIRARSLRVATAMERPVRITAAIVLTLLIVGMVVRQRSELGDYFAQAGLIMALLSVLVLLVGYSSARLTGLGERQAVSIQFEGCLQNVALAIAIGASPMFGLANETFAIPAAMYGLLMFVPVAGITFFYARQERRRKRSEGLAAADLKEA